MLMLGWGMGWGRVLTFTCTCKACWCYVGDGVGYDVNVQLHLLCENPRAAMKRKEKVFILEKCLLNQHSSIGFQRMDFRSHAKQNDIFARDCSMKVFCEYCWVFTYSQDQHRSIYPGSQTWPQPRYLEHLWSHSTSFRLMCIGRLLTTLNH